ncbi:MAG TPA: hypothetical protein VE984_08445 [Gaiellaceae bacterium]|nr:hypothetical protein [Gaiellaceae bacterium]
MIRAVRRAVLAVVCLAVPGAARAAAGDALHELALRYAPVVRLSEQEAPCARGESFEPIDVRAIFGDSRVVLRGPAGFAEAAPRAADVARLGDAYALDFPGNALTSPACSYERWQRRITTRRAATVYAHVASEDGKLGLQYWFFYVYNDFNNKHEGDWELIQLDFDAATPAAALRTHPFEVGYSQHAAGERAEWGAAKLELVDGTHPVVYPAEGSHAGYFSGALYLGRSAAEGFGCDDTNPPWRQLRPSVEVIPESRRAARAAFPGSPSVAAGASGAKASTTRRRGRPRRRSGRGRSAGRTGPGARAASPSPADARSGRPRRRSSAARWAARRRS